jgi:hypothetical protein|tara:strand:- start:235 stop:603 length:369 start_codon:yes stop_codon:yes gene_type:complete
LNKFSFDLGSTFKIYLLESKLFDDANTIANKVENDYLFTYFGASKRIQALAKRVILENHRDIAFELNQAVRVLGDKRESLIIERVKEKFPSYFEEPEIKDSMVITFTILLFGALLMAGILMN